MEHTHIILDSYSLLSITSQWYSLSTVFRPIYGRYLTSNDGDAIVCMVHLLTEKRYLPIWNYYKLH